MLIPVIALTAPEFKSSGRHAFALPAACAVRALKNGGHRAYRQAEKACGRCQTEYAVEETVYDMGAPAGI